MNVPAGVTADLHDLARFVAAQDDVYETALAELRAGAKQSHWMWFVFPQIAGLGRSAMSRRYAIHSVEEAGAYLDHPLLGGRLRTCVAAVLSRLPVAVEAVFGPVDAIKLNSSMTLFEAVGGEAELFGRCLDAAFGGRRDRATLRALASPAAE